MSERTAKRYAHLYAPLFSKRDLGGNPEEKLKELFLRNPEQAFDRVIEKIIKRLGEALYLLFSNIRDRALNGDPDAEAEFLHYLRKHRKFINLVPEIGDLYHDTCQNLRKAWEEIENLLGFRVMFYIDGTIQLPEEPYEYDHEHNLGPDGGMVCDAWRIIAQTLEEYGLLKAFKIPIKNF
jgi:hypothetical protein